MPIPIDNLIRTNRKTIALIVQRDGSLTVRAPLRMADYHIRDFVDQHTGWILKTQAKIRSTHMIEKKYVKGETFLFLGKKYPLNIVTNQRGSLSFDNEKFSITPASLPQAEKIFIHWYKTQAKRILSEQVSQLAGIHGFSYQKIRISSARTRWGSCSSKNTLSFTYRLIMAPPEVVKYVIIHELVHTKIKNHSRSFWAAVEKIIPEHKKYKSWLRKNGPLIN